MKLLPPPSGWLLGYSIFFPLIGIGIGYEVHKHYSLPLLISAISSVVLGVLLWLRTPFALLFNAVFSLSLIAWGTLTLLQTGTYSFLIGGLCLLVGCWTFREDIEIQRRSM
ncbi:MAG: hypothetical protein AAF802_21865 [Planctomycetota bacterium]